MLTVKTGDKVERNVSINESDMIVERRQSTKRKADDPVAYVTTWTFDFSKVGMKDLLELASRTVNIAMQGQFRKCPVAEINDWDGKEFDVKEWLDAGGRQKLSKEEKVKRVFDGMSEEEKLKLLDDLSALMKPQAE